MRIDVNADVGESFGAYTMGDDAALMASITSANVAAGFHGGDPSVLRATIRLAATHGVAVGAHPGLPDLAGFGRREMRISGAEAEDLVLYQVAAVGGIARAEGLALQHVKPHGALFHMAARDADLAAAVARAVAAFDRRLILVGPQGSKLVAAGRALGLRVAVEAFADRSYEPDGSLTPRGAPGALIDNPEALVERAVRMVIERVVRTAGGAVVPLEPDTICVHGDTPNAGWLAARLRRGLQEAGIVVMAVGAR
jgi:5-oxoprolinase (ATP-hydrolysing) subunit A